MSIAADFVIDIDNRILRHDSGATVYSVNDLYTYAQDYFDEITLLSVTVPLSAQTPTEYSLINGWFIPEETYKFLRGGAIKTIGWDTALYDDGIDIVVLSGSYVSCVATDIGKVVTDGSATGVLLDYNNTLQKWWIRRIIGTLVGAVSVNSGTGSGTVLTSTSGENTYSNVYTLGAIEPSVTNILYVEQVNTELTDNQISQYWPSGHIDILIKVKEANIFIDSGRVRVYDREFSTLYSHFSIDLSSGGRNPVPLSTSDDTNNQTLAAVVSTWNDVTVTFGTITRDLLNGNGPQVYDVEIDCGTRSSLSEVYQRLKLITSRDSGFTLNSKPGQFYLAASPSYSEVITAPFGTYAGGQFFGARGVFLKNVPGVDTNSYSLTTSSGVSQLPPYLAGITLSFNDVLAADGADAKYNLYYKQINVSGVSSAFGTVKGVLVNRADAVTPIQGNLTGNVTSVSVDFDYDRNTQAVWTPNASYFENDFYRYSTTWYKVTTPYVSSSTFGLIDIANSDATTGPEVVLVAIGLDAAQYVQVSSTIARTTLNSISASGVQEFNYSEAVV